MTGILTTARLVCKDSQAREKAIEAFRKIIAYTTPNEPEVLQYICALPVDDSVGTEIYMIEEYVKKLLSWIRELINMQICQSGSKRRTSSHQACARSDTTIHYRRCTCYTT
jgi:hypothetical protein